MFLHFILCYCKTGMHLSFVICEASSTTLKLGWICGPYTEKLSVSGPHSFLKDTFYQYSLLLLTSWNTIIQYKYNNTGLFKTLPITKFTRCAYYKKLVQMSLNAVWLLSWKHLADTRMFRFGLIWCSRLKYHVLNKQYNTELSKFVCYC